MLATKQTNPFYVAISVWLVPSSAFLQTVIQSRKSKNGPYHQIQELGYNSWFFKKEPTSCIRAPLKTVLFRACGVSHVLLASDAHKHGALRTVRPHVFQPTLRFSARGFLAFTKNSWFLEVPISLLWLGWRGNENALN